MIYSLESKSQQLLKQTLHFFEFGSVNMNEKATLLLIHGNFCTKQIWYKNIDELVQKYCGHIVVVDLRGYGDSSYNQKCNQLKDWCDDLAQFCSLMNIQKCVPIGFCFGGLVAMKLAEIAPKLVEKIVLAASVGYQGMDLQPNMVYWQLIRSLIEENKRQEYSNLFYTFVKCEKNPMHDLLVDKIMKQRCSKEVFKALQTKSIDIQAIKPILANSLAIHGVEDQVITIEEFQKTGKYCKKFIKVDAIRHMVLMKYEKIVDDIVSFMIDQ